MNFLIIIQKEKKNTRHQNPAYTTIITNQEQERKQRYKRWKEPKKRHLRKKIRKVDPLSRLAKRAHKIKHSTMWSSWSGIRCNPKGMTIAILLMLSSNWPTHAIWTPIMVTSLLAEETSNTPTVATDRKYVEAKHDTTPHRNGYTTHYTKWLTYYKTSNSLLYAPETYFLTLKIKYTDEQSTPQPLCQEQEIPSSKTLINYSSDRPSGFHT